MSATGMGELVSEVARLQQGLETLSYYEFLGLKPSADYIAVREAFYSRAQRFHPDRFVAMGAQTVKQAVYSVYKRMTEAYNVLSNPELRVVYDTAFRQGNAHRLSAEARSRRLDARERQVKNPFARIYLRSGQEKLSRGDLNGAWIDVELGLSIEEAPPLRELHTQVIRRMVRP